jgi:uncharacterized protein
MESIKTFNHVGLSEYLAEHRLMAARCTKCGELCLPPRPICPKCYEARMEWVELSGEGRLEGFTVVYVGLPEMIEAGYDRQRPYCSGVVRLAEGPAVSGQVVGEDDGWGSIEVGMPVRAVFIERGEKTVLGFERKKD